MITITALPVSSKELFTLTEKTLQGEAIVGEDVAKFEKNLVDYLAVKKALAFNSGRTALCVALQSLDLRPGDEVIVPAYTCAIVFEVVLRLGLKPIPIDANAGTYNIDASLIPKVITSRTKAIIPVHLFGRPCEMDLIMEIAGKHGLYVIEDAAQALGAEYTLKKVGAFGDLAIFSFGAGKSITGGEGGAIVINNEDLLQRINELHADLPKPDVKWVFHVIRNILAMAGFSNPHIYWLIKNIVRKSIATKDNAILQNCIELTRNDRKMLNPTIKLMHMPNISAAIADIQIKRIDFFNRRRIENALFLTKKLDELHANLQTPRVDSKVKSIYTRYVIKVHYRKRSSLIKALNTHGVEAGPAYTFSPEILGDFSSGAFPHSKELSTSLMTLSNHPHLSRSDLCSVASAIAHAPFE